MNDLDQLSLNNVRLLSGNSHPELSEKISRHLRIPLVKRTLDKFSNSEIRLLIEENIRNKNIIIIQTGSAQNGNSVNDHIMETLIMIDACKRSSCQSITLLIPCFPYARQDKKDKPRCPISAKVIAFLLENAGVTRVVTLDLHASQIAGFFNVPVDNLYSVNI